MSATVVGVMDRDSWTARTDNIVVVDARRRRLLWIPRDLFSKVVGDRINEAFGRGGPELLLAALRELGIPAESSVVLLRSAVERAIANLRISVPIDRTRRYWYPLEPTLNLQDGAKLVVFEPPQETLVGERIHQWVGARKSADTPPPKLPDLDRIERQKILVRRLLEERFDFSRTLTDPALVAVHGAGALEQLGAVRADWELRTYNMVKPMTINGKMVLVRDSSRLLRIRNWLRRS
jgi:anionic cell wall polymer biosynthesis LytR-Cps2A-Psr (LCP) family protein